MKQIKTWTWRQRLYVWRKTEYVRTKMSCFLLAKLNVVSLCYVMSCEKNQSLSFFSSILIELRPVQGVSWILRHDKTWKNSHQWYARSKQQNGTLGWSSCDVRTRISSNLIKHCRWEENYVKKFLLVGGWTVVAILHNTTTSWHTLVTDEFSSNFDRIRKKTTAKTFQELTCRILK